MKRIRTLLCVIAVCAAGAHPAAGQNVTTGTITGVVRDAQGGVLPGATVTATHQPTGTVYEGATEGDGRFSLLNVRVGGPYEINASLAGFRTQAQTGVQVSLGQSTALEFTLQLDTITETVTVTAEASALFSPSNTGTSANVQQDIIENLPTVQRSIQDFARVNPFFAPTATNANTGLALSVAGRSGRYNNLQIDGAVNNDLFGLADSALPGGQANTEPISLDAIQELQLVVAPYDVRQGNFSGGGINAITRSGSNRFTGSAYYLFRNQDWVGDGVDDRPIATFSDKTGGGRVGGPIVQNRAFFFGVAEAQRRQTPSGWSLDGSSGQTFGRVAEAQRVLNVLQSRYGYDPGGITEFIRRNPNDKIFARGDFNLNSSHQLVVRHNFIDSVNDVGTPTNTRFIFPDQFYEFNSRANSTVGQVNSTFGKAVNEARVTYQRIRDFRANRAEPFPQVNVRLTGGQDLRFGTEQFSTRNQLDQDIIEIHNDLTWIVGTHQFTFGTHNEFFKFRNLFIRDNFGTYDFASLELFEAGLAQSFDYSFSATSDPLQSARFWVYQLGFYAGDLWRVRDNVSLNYGVRVDMPIFPDTPNANATVQSLYGIRTDVTPETATWSPRIGMNWDLSEDETRQQVRAGVGIFGGRTPYVWLSNQYTSTGNEFTRVSTGFNATTNRFPFVPDPNAQPRNLGTAATNEINSIDTGYDFPQLIRGNVGYDRSLIGGLIGTVEFVFSETMKDIDYKNVNLRAAGVRPDGRAFYARANPAFSDVIFLTNTDQGNAWQLAFKLDKPFRNGWYATGSYLYGRSRTVNDGGSSQARSNWINNYFANDVNDVPVATSNFDPAHRITASMAYEVPLGPTRATLSLYYNGQTGRPYAYRYSNDVNVDQGTTNDLFYIPRDASDVIIANGTFDQLMAFINGGDCTDLTPGSIVDRNSCRAPWVNTLDFHAAVDVPVGRYSGEVTFDILNLINLFDSGSGLVEYATFNGIAPASAAVDPATGKWVYTLNNIVTTPATSPRFSRDDLRSRWQAQVGFRFRF